MPRARPTGEFESVIALKAQGLTDREISLRTGVPINTIRTWRNRRQPRLRERQLRADETCPECREGRHDFAAVPRETYAYLLGVYLGDGCITRNKTTWTLRIALDAGYPGIINECAEAVRTINGGRYVSCLQHHNGNHCVVVSSTWRAWPCLFPQHGPGRKHHRKISLTRWQQDIVDAAPYAFLRGLIHTDGWRGLNKVHVKGKDYSYPRYQFSNRSDDIRRLFTDTCERLGVAWRQWTRYHISIARRESVAILDAHIGPKS